MAAIEAEGLAWQYKASKRRSGSGVINPGRSNTCASTTIVIAGLPLLPGESFGLDRRRSGVPASQLHRFVIARRGGGVPVA